MNFSYTAVWNDTVALMKSHGSLLLAVAGVFIFLPLLLTGYLLPAPTSNSDPFGALQIYYGENWHWLALGSLINSLGAIAIYRLLFANGRLSVGQAIGGALGLLPFYFIMTVLLSMAVGAGLVLFILPGIYLLGRLIAAAPAMVAENRRNPIEAIGESWRLSKRRGWAIAGLIVIVGIAGSILTFVLTAVFGSVFLLLGREGIGGLLALIVTAAINSVFYTVLIVLIAAIYRALRGTPAAATTSGS